MNMNEDKNAFHTYSSSSLNVQKYRVLGTSTEGLELKRMIDKVQEMESQRQMLIEQLRTQLHEDDLTKKLLTEKDADTSVRSFTYFTYSNITTGSRLLIRDMLEMKESPYENYLNFFSLCRSIPQFLLKKL